MSNHTYLFTVGGVSFYEHEKFGDEFNLIAKIDGKWIDTYYMDKPSIEEVKELVADVMDGHEETYEILERLKMENEYVDDWSCKECGHTGISEAEDACPECDSTWTEQND